MKIQIVIPAINLWYKYTKPCLDSIQSEHECRVLLIDNQSTDETKIEAGKLVSDKFAHHRNEDRWSCAKSWNFGISDGFTRGYDYVLVLNNDVLLHPKAIDQLVKRMGRKEKEVVMVSCMDIKGEADNPADFFRWLVASKESVAESYNPNFSAFMINKDCWEMIGEFDENFKPAYFEDNDYHHRIVISGNKAVCVPTAMFYHYGSATQNEALDRPVCEPPQFRQNRDYYIKKWGGVPDKETFQKPFNEI